MIDMEKAKIIAVDFDGCLVENKWPEMGEPNKLLFVDLIRRQMSGAKIILWTCRTGKLLKSAVLFCRENGLVFDAINENLQSTIDFMGGDTRKIYADVYVDDKALSICAEDCKGGRKDEV